MGKMNQPRVVLCDLDGVVWLAHQPIPGSVEAIRRLREAGTRVIFVTNNSFSTYEQQVAALEKIGIPARGDVISSAMSAVTAVQPHWRVLLCGGDGLEQELSQHGCEVVVAFRDRAAPGPFDAVVVGFHREFDFAVLTDALSAVRAGALLVGSNDDSTYPTPNGPIPGGGAILASIAKASGHTPVVTGKPHAPMASLVTAMCPDVDIADIVMVGDRLDTDGEFARTIGCRFALVLSGVTIEATHSDADVVSRDLAGVADALLGP